MQVLGHTDTSFFSGIILWSGKKKLGRNENRKQAGNYKLTSSFKILYLHVMVFRKVPEF